MIERTFLHLPGVGLATERRLWSVGFGTWGDLWAALQDGRSPRDLLRTGRQRELFTFRPQGPADAKAIQWMDVLDRSRVALRDKDYRCFVELLPAADQWRLLESVPDDTLYLDIETTGLSAELHYVTVVGALYKGAFHQWTWPEPLDGLAELLHSAPLVVTFNGRRFDIRFLRLKYPAIPEPRAHVDLLYIARSAGLPGGQKSIEEQLGLTRDDAVRGVDGAEAVACWCRALYGDRQSYRQLLAYNRADVELMPEIASRLCSTLRRQLLQSEANAAGIGLTRSIFARRPPPFAVLQQSWRQHRPGLHRLETRLRSRFGRPPVVVGIDLRAKVAKPTGWARCEGARVETQVVFDDDRILELTLAAKPDIVSIDAPLFLPRGRRSVSDDSPCRQEGGIVRDAERILWARGIRVYPALIRQMQGLTQRGIELTRVFQSHGIKVIESYPGAAQDILNIPRKKVDESLLRRGLHQFGYQLRGTMTHDELDAVTSALVGQFYLADAYEAIGADDEGYMIIPRSPTFAGSARKRVVSIAGLPGAGKTTLARALAQRLGWRTFVLGDALRHRANTDASLRAAIGRGDLAPESLVYELIRGAARDSGAQGLLLDGFPRHRDQLGLARELFQNQWSLLLVEANPSVAMQRISSRTVCRHCGYVATCNGFTLSPCPNCGVSGWHRREEDADAPLARRMEDSGTQLSKLLAGVTSSDILRVDGCAPVDDVASQAVAQLMTTRFKRSY